MGALVGRLKSAYGVTEAERTEYRERGFFVREGLFTEHELVRLRNAVEDIHRRIKAEAGAGEPIERIDGLAFQNVLGSRIKWEWNEEIDAIRSMEPVHHLSAAVDSFLDHDRLCAIARDIINVPEISVFTDKLNFKRPGGSPFPWHQDAPYWAYCCKHLDQLVSVQIYLDEATEENGCLWVVPGSHRRGHIPAPSDGTRLGRLYTDINQIDGPAPLALTGSAGSAIFFDSYVVHGSKRNGTNTNRRALIFTYQPAGLPYRDRADVRIPVRRRFGSRIGSVLQRALSVFRP